MFVNLVQEFSRRFVRHKLPWCCPVQLQKAEFQDWLEQTISSIVKSELAKDDSDARPFINDDDGCGSDDDGSCTGESSDDDSDDDSEDGSEDGRCGSKVSQRKSLSREAKKQKTCETYGNDGDDDEDDSGHDSDDGDDDGHDSDWNESD